jgi:hypothetical protein
MTRDELIAIGKARYGDNWIKLLAEEIGYNQATLWKIANGRIPHVSRRIELEICSLQPLATESAEYWLPIPSTGGEFEASSLGRIKRVMRSGVRYGGRVVKTAPDTYFNRGGYHVVNVTVGGEHKTLLAHKLIAEAFLGPRPDGLVINHLDGSKANNAPSNLEYCSSRENTLHALRLGLAKPPTRKSNRPHRDGVFLV